MGSHNADEAYHRQLNLSVFIYFYSGVYKAGYLW